MSELTSRQKQAITSRKNIYRCAMDLFAQYSYEKVTIKDICNAAGISIGGFYHYYNSKMDILNEGYHLFDEKIQEHFHEKTTNTPIENIVFLIQEQCRSIEDLGISAFAQLYKSQLTSDDKYILNTERFFYHAMLDSVTQAVEKGVLHGDIDTITNEILSVSRGIIYDWIMHEGTYNLMQKSLKLVQIITEYYK